MVFAQQLTSTNISDLDEFGFAVAYSDNRIIVGSPAMIQLEVLLP